MTNSIKNYWVNRKVKQQQLHDREETSAFNIIEKNGVIYITAGQRAIRTVNPKCTAQEIIEMLTECREAQLKFKKEH